MVEHLSDPKDTWAELGCLLADEGKLIIEIPNVNDALLTLYNNKGFQNLSCWRQQQYLYDQNIISELVRPAGLRLDWVKHVHRYQLSNHLHWLASGNQGGYIK